MKERWLIFKKMGIEFMGLLSLASDTGKNK